MRDNILLEDVGVTRRLKVIQGHVHAVEKMMEEKRPYDEIIFQLEAIRSAIVKTTAVAAQYYAKTCIYDALEKGDRSNESLNKPIEILMRVLQHTTTINQVVSHK